MLCGTRTTMSIQSRFYLKNQFRFEKKYSYLSLIKNSDDTPETIEATQVTSPQPCPWNGNGESFRESYEQLLMVSAHDNA